jgi:uncharacterized membrane protein HdeD (DUF308 family)
METAPQPPLPHLKENDREPRNWKWVLLLGSLLMLLGLIAVSSSFLTTFFSILFLGLLLILSGIAQIVQSFGSNKWTNFFLSLGMGVLYIVVGFLCVTRPGESAINLTLLIAAFCLIAGLFKMLVAALLRFEYWKWIFFNGSVTFLLGILILLNWPLSGLSMIGLFVGAEMILSGWSWLLLSFKMRKHIF